MAKRPQKPPKMWMYVPAKPPKQKVPEDLKAEVTAQAEVLIEEWKPQFIKEPPKGHQFNYIVDLYTKWFRSYFYYRGDQRRCVLSSVMITVRAEN
jgi:hypothetical protein